MKIILRWPVCFGAILLLLLQGFVLSAQVELSFSQPSGFFNTPILVQIKSDASDIDIRYTLNGSIPGPDDLQYVRPLIFSQLGVVNSHLSMIPTTPELENLYYKWNEPAGTKQLANIIRARAFQNGQPVSNVITGFYLVVPAKAIRIWAITMGVEPNGKDLLILHTSTPMAR